VFRIGDEEMINLQIEWAKVLDVNNSTSFINVYGLWILLGIIVLIWIISTIVKSAKAKKGDKNMETKTAKVEENMIRARMKEIQNDIALKRNKEWEEYNAMTQRHRAEESELMEEWNILKIKLDKL
jgi:type VI protein secretion system component VasK